MKGSKSILYAACAVMLGLAFDARAMDDDLGGLLFEPYRPGDPDSLLVPRSALGRGIGLRGGLFVPVGAEGDWDVAPRIGVFYRDAWRGYSGLAGELGFDVMRLRGERLPGADVSSTVVLLHYSVIFSSLAWPQPYSANAYVGLGLEFGFENALWQETDESVSRSGGALNASAGLTNGQWDTRLSYSVFIGNGGASGGILLTVGRIF